MKKLISAILAVVLLVGTLALEVGAALDPIYMLDDSGKPIDGVIDYTATVKQYLTTENEFKTDAEKLSTMTLKYEKNGYQLWADEFTGEVATVNLASGQILFSNPRDIGSKNATSSSKADNAIKYDLMSQILVDYEEVTTDATGTLNSFKEAAMNGQIDVKTIKNGLRVEYTIGREDTKYLVPRLIEKTRFEENILKVIAAEFAPKWGLSVEDYMLVAETKAMDMDYAKVRAFYSLKDPNAEDVTDQDLLVMQNEFEITKKPYGDGLMAVYVCDKNITPKNLSEVETRIKTYCPLYTFEQLDYDHTLTDYETNDKAPPLFKMALEYRLDEFGLTVRLPANGIRFNETEYRLTGVTILPWMGAGSNDNTGYAFYPDGSGAIFRFEDNTAKKNLKIDGSIYGQDFAYHNITASHREAIRYPVFGIVKNRELTSAELEGENNNDTTNNTPPGVEEGTTDDTSTQDKVELTPEQKTLSSGFLAILEEGDSLAKVELLFYNAVCKYDTVRFTVNPRPKDTYILSDAVSVGENKEVDVVSKRKYVGDYKIRYIMLTDDEIAAEKNITNYYEPSWLGMARAYRDYLTSPYSTGTQNESKDKQVSVLNALTAQDVKEDIPLYIETFGSMNTIKKVLSVPVNTKVALTSFDDVKAMYKKLSEEAGIDNVNFKLTGYYNGGMYSSVPYKLKFEKSVGGKKGFESLLADAKANNYGVYLNFDFVYSASKATKMFDGLSNSRDLVRAIDDRYVSKQYYSATRQSYTSYFELAISPSRYTYFYDKVSKEYLSYNPIGISLSTLASDLNSDFDEDDPYNRDDSKKFTSELFDRMNKDYGSVMADSANAYTWQYVDHMINVAVDSSRLVKASNSVPFLGVVLHGYVQFAGTPMNMEGNIGYAMLKAIENGSGIYFILSYDNTELLKNDVQFSQYYSVRYDIWFDELAERYDAVNDVLKDLQLKLIIDHEFLIGERVPDENEIAADKAEEDAKLEAEKLAKEEAERINRINQIREGRYSALSNTEKNLADTLKMVARFNDTLAEDGTVTKQGYINVLKNHLANLEALDYLNAVVKAEEDLKIAEEEFAPINAEYTALDEEYQRINSLFVKADGDLKKDPDNEAKKQLRDDLYNQRREANAAKREKQVDYDNAKGKVDKAKKTYDDLIKNTDLTELTKVHKEVGDYIETFIKYKNLLEKDMDNMNVAYEEITKRDANGNYVHSDTVVNDINVKYQAMQNAAKSLTDAIDSVMNEYKAMYDTIIKYCPDQDYLTEEEESEEDKVDDEKKDEGYVYTKYTSDDGNIIAVTYGDGEDTPYRTFILNYNFFDITTKYNGKDYTVKAFSYAIVEN